MSFLIDTNVISELRKDRRADPNVLRWVDSTPPQEHYTSVLVIGELRRGVERARRRDLPQALILETWLATVIANYQGRILSVDDRIAEAWGAMGVPDPLPAVDSLPAATAIIHRMILVTRNRADMTRTGVAILDPFEP